MSEEQGVLFTLFFGVCYFYNSTCQKTFDKLISFLLSGLLLGSLIMRDYILNGSPLTYSEEAYLILTIILFYFSIPILVKCLRSHIKIKFFVGLFIFFVSYHLFFALINYAVYSYNNAAFQSVTTNELQQKSDVTNRYIRNAQELILLNSYIQTCKALMNLNTIKVRREAVGSTSTNLYIIFHEQNNVFITVEEFCGSPENVANFLRVQLGKDAFIEKRNQEFGSELYKLINEDDVPVGTVRYLKPEEYAGVREAIDKFLVFTLVEYNKVREKLKNYNINAYSLSILDFLVYAFNVSSQMGNGIVLSNNSISKLLSVLMAVLNVYILWLGVEHKSIAPTVKKKKKTINKKQTSSGIEKKI